MQELSIFQYKNNILEYEEISKGSKKILCFNGYGKLTKDFHVFKDFFALDINAIAVNLPYHGNSTWNIGLANKEELFTALLKHLGWEENKVHLFAYSIGARYAYSLAQLFPEKIKSIYLLAPDGIFPNVISNLATFNPAGKRLMNAFINHAGFIIFILKYLKNVKILSENDFAFFMRKISTKQDRQMLQKVWKEVYTTTPSFKELFVSTKNGLEPVEKLNSIQWNIFLGTKDKVFPYKKIKKLIPICDNITIHSWDSGHAMLKESIGYKLSLKEKTISQE